MLDQLLLALGVVALYGTLCWFCLRSNTDDVAAGIATGEILIGYASQSGEAERIAKQHAERLSCQGPVTALPLNRITPDIMGGAALALFIVSTYGEGESPDNALGFARQWSTAAAKKGDPQSLQRLRFAVLALGDSSYRFYCAFGKQLAAGLSAHGAHALFEPVLVDRLAPEHLQLWREHLAETGLFEAGQLAFSDADVAPVYPCILERRELLNSGSPGGPMFHLRLRAGGESAADTPVMSWQAGDIAVITVPGRVPQHREYSIASVPADGGLEFVVRQVCKDDASFGLGSGYLTNTLAVGSAVMLSVRSNKGFHAPESDKPMILIGNGTGIAGLRAHLRHRELQGGTRSWLVFGERTEAYDKVFDDDIERWRKTGMLSEVDRVFSRDGGDCRYVQDLLTRKAREIKQWIDAGAVIYVCGSLQGMASSVHRALLDAVGEAQLESLTLDGRYRRDVY